MITIDDCLEGKVTKEDLNLGWVLSLDHGWLQLSYTVRDFSWQSVQDAPEDKVNKFLASDVYLKMRALLEEARSKRKSLFYQANSISTMKFFLEQDNVKVDLDKLVRAKARSMLMGSEASKSLKRESCV